MKKLLVTFTLACATFALAATASASLGVGVNDDTPKDGGQSTWFYSTMQSEGLKINTISIRWDETNPSDIPAAAGVDQAIAKAKANGVTIELDLYPLHSAAFTGGQRFPHSTDPEAYGNTANIQAFGAWAGSVAKRFPSVSLFVVMNECNQPLFVNPQWDSAGQNQSAEICGRALAAAYDAIKAAGPATVYGVGLSPRGNDQPNAASNSSTTPVSFLGAMGAWFKAFAQKTGRSNGIMDGFDFHPYPVPQSQPFAQGYSNVKEASVTNLSRIYQAFYNGFNGTPQKTIGQQSGGGLPVSLNETGVQTSPGTHMAAYSGDALGTSSGIYGAYATESYQASWYQEMLDLVACDPNIQFVNIFHLVDDSTLGNGWQSGLYYADQQPKQSAQTVHDWIARTGGNCAGTVHSWTPSGVSTGATTTTTAKGKAKTKTTTAKAKGKPAPKAKTPPGKAKGKK